MTKYAAASLTLLAIAGVIWAAVVYTRAASFPVRAAPVAVSADPQSKAGEDAMSHVHALDRMLTQVDDSMHAVPMTLASAPLGPSAKAASGNAPVIARAPEAHGPVISLVYLSPSFQRVVIDGTVLAVGDTLPGAGRVVAIGADEIALMRGKQRYTLPVPKGPPLGSVSTPVVAKAAK